MNTTNQEYTTEFKVANTNYGKITVPKGVKVTHQTACGIDENYNFVNEFDWIYIKYPNIANLLVSDMQNYGLDIPKEFINKVN